MNDFAAPCPPFSPIREVFPDVFQVQGGFGFGPGLSISRNMTIIRQGKELTLVNSVRLSPEREAEMLALGDVKHLCRIGEFHGIDDPYYVNRFRPAYWTPPGMTHRSGIKADHELAPGSTPVSGSKVFRFAKGRGIEVALLVERDGGILVTCDSYQNWTTFEGCSTLGGVMMRMMRFGPIHIGAPWAKRMGPAVREDFERLLEEKFAHLAPGHGTALRDKAKEGLRTAISKRFG